MILEKNKSSEGCPSWGISIILIVLRKKEKTGSFHSTDIKRANETRNEEKTVDKSIRDASDVFVGEGDVVALV